MKRQVHTVASLRSLRRRRITESEVGLEFLLSSGQQGQPQQEPVDKPMQSEAPGPKVSECEVQARITQTRDSRERLKVSEERRGGREQRYKGNEAVQSHLHQEEATLEPRAEPGMLLLLLLLLR